MHINHVLVVNGEIEQNTKTYTESQGGVNINYITFKLIKFKNANPE